MKHNQKILQREWDKCAQQGDHKGALKASLRIKALDLGIELDEARLDDVGYYLPILIAHRLWYKGRI